MSNIEILTTLEEAKLNIINCDMLSLPLAITNFKTTIETEAALKKIYDEKIELYQQLQHNSDFKELTYQLCTQIVKELQEVQDINTHKMKEQGYEVPEIILSIDNVTPIIGAQDLYTAATNLIFYNIDLYIQQLNKNFRNYITNNYDIPLFSRNIVIYKEYYESQINNSQINKFKHSEIQSIATKIRDLLDGSYSYHFFDFNFQRNNFNEQLKIAAINMIDDFIYYIKNSGQLLNEASDTAKTDVSNNHQNCYIPSEILNLSDCYKITYQVLVQYSYKSLPKIAEERHLSVSTLKDHIETICNNLNIDNGIRSLREYLNSKTSISEG